MINDPLEKVGLGIVYGKWLHASDWMSVYRPFGFYGNPMKLYDKFHEKVAHKIKRLSGRTLLIDCHSFSFLPTVLNPGFSDIDICIGYNDDETRPNKVTIGIIAQHFRSLGYNVDINEPFSNSKTFAVPCEYHSVMIEVNKRL